MDIALRCGIYGKGRCKSMLRIRGGWKTNSMQSFHLIRHYEYILPSSFMWYRYGRWISAGFAAELEKDRF
jgi:hypothetical protein